MLSRSRAVLIGGMVSLFAAAGAFAATLGGGSDIGQTSTNATACPETSYIQATTHGDVSYVVPAGATRIDSWSTAGLEGSGGRVSLMVFRKIGPDYKVVGESAQETVSGAGTFTFATSIAVQGGEVLGMWTSDGACRFATPNPDDEYLTWTSPTSEPPVGTQLSGAGLFGTNDFRLSIAAHLSAATTSTPAAPQEDRAGYCMPSPVERADGTTGQFVDLLAGEPATDSRYAGATPALYGQGYGLTCDDLTALGYTDSGHKVDGSGTVNPDAAANLYEYFTK